MCDESRQEEQAAEQWVAYRDQREDMLQQLQHDLEMRDAEIAKTQEDITKVKKILFDLGPKIIEMRETIENLKAENYALRVNLRRK